MKATKIKLIHFRSAKQLELNLEPNLNVFVGVNGAGKSTILDALAISLSWASARLRAATGSGRRILETDINNDMNFAGIELTCEVDDDKLNQIFWRLTQTRKGRNLDSHKTDSVYEVTSLKGISVWAGQQRDQLQKADVNLILPIFVYYPVNRAVLDIPLRIRKRHSFDRIDAYDDSLTSGANFRSFFEWYRDREDQENERLRETGKLIEDPQLKAVRSAIAMFLPEMSNISVKRSPLRLEVKKKGINLRVDQLSDGEKCLFAMVGDLSRRLAIANPTLDKPLQGAGIVIIDEIDLHLHPEWQRMVVTRFTETFPNCQFFLSTHSPQVYGEVDAPCIRRLMDDPIDGLVSTTPKQALGLDSSEILEEEMESRSRNQDVADKLKTIFQLIDDEQYPMAKEQIEVLRKKVRGSIPEIVRAEALITMLLPDGGESE